jgi:hypothetical protein
MATDPKNAIDFGPTANEVGDAFATIEETAAGLAVQRVAEVHYCDACADGEWRVGHGHGWDCPLRKRRHLPRTNEGSSDAER